MPTPYGTFSVYGVQSGLPSGGSQTLGPLLIPFSDTQLLFDYTFGSAGTEPFTIPAVALTGVWIIPSSASGTLSLIVGSGTAFHISPINPTFLALDPNNLPATFQLVASAAITVAIQYV